MLTHDEAELYDRQIRLWGVNAQSRIRQSRVLMLGFNGVASEVAKTLVLAGIDTLTIVDDETLQESDVTSNLFCRRQNTENENGTNYRTHDVQEKMRSLNPLVKVNIENVPLLSKKAEEYKEYDLVTLHSVLTIEDIDKINSICRSYRIKFYIVLDFGFFGFMFNDLGTEFKFTYEEFSKVSDQKEQEKKHSGGEDDPIDLSVVDGNEDVGYGTSDDEDNRPKKRRRLHSPNREAPQAKNENEKENTVGSLPYVTFKDMISSNNASFTRKSSPVLLIYLAMFKFYSEHKHLPRLDDKDFNKEDTSRLNDIVTALKGNLNVPDNVYKKLDDDWTESILGSLSPVCAVVGGVAGQDMIRALSNKDVPICNTFSFDGFSMNGSVVKVGLPDMDSNQGAKPVVRDFLQIDDDD